MPRLISLAVLLVMIVVLGVTFFKVVAPFLMPLFLAAMTAIICQPLYRYFLMRCKNRLGPAAGLTTLTVMASIMVPLMTGIMIASLQLYKFASTIGDDAQVAAKAKALVSRTVEFGNRHLPANLQADPDRIYHEIKIAVEQELSRIGDLSLGRDLPTVGAESSLEVEQEPIDTIEEKPDGDLPPEFDAPPKTEAPAQVAKSEPRSPAAEAASSQAGAASSSLSLGRAAAGAAGTTLSVLTGTAGLILRFTIGLMMYGVALFYFLADGTMLLRAAETMIPVHADYQRQLFTEFSKAVRSVVLATFFAAIAQGVATTAALWFFGFDHLFVLFVLATLGAMVPLAGTWLVWLPCAVVLFFDGHPWQGLVLALYGAAFVGFLDNVIRTYVLNSNVKLHPLLAFISVLGGIQVMGLWGVFIGPIVASCLHALVKIFNLELVQLSKERQAKLNDLIGESPPLEKLPPHGAG